MNEELYLFILRIELYFCDMNFDGFALTRKQITSLLKEADVDQILLLKSDQISMRCFLSIGR